MYFEGVSQTVGVKKLSSSDLIRGPMPEPDSPSAMGPRIKSEDDNYCSGHGSARCVENQNCRAIRHLPSYPASAKLVRPHKGAVVTLTTYSCSIATGGPTSPDIELYRPMGTQHVE